MDALAKEYVTTKVESDKAPSTIQARPVPVRQDTSDSLLYKVRDGGVLQLNRKQFLHYNYPNFEERDILIEEAEMRISPYNPARKDNIVHKAGKCRFPANSSFPEVQWDHMAASLLVTIITQGGKAGHNICTDINGVGMLSCDLSIRRAAPLHDVTFTMDSRIYERQGRAWSKSDWRFFQAGKEFASAKVLACGIMRDYTKLMKNRSSKKINVAADIMDGA